MERNLTMTGQQNSDSLRERTIQELKTRREKLLNNGVNSIPSPFKRFSDDFVGIEQGTYYTITSFTKGGKSQFTSYTFIYNALMFAYYSKKDIKVTILYFALEETPERIMQRFMSYILNDFTKGKIRISPSGLRSTKNDCPVPQEVLDLLENDEIKDILDYFEANIHFPTESNPTGIYKYCKNYAEQHGKVITKKSKYKDEFGNIQEVDAFSRYIPDNPNEYVIPIIDTINLVDEERGMDKKKSMDKLSEYLAKHLRNRYNQSPVVIQQQNFDQEGNDAFKLNRIRPSIASMGDSKYTSRDSNVVLGLFSPMRFGLNEYMGYDITKFKDHIRFLEVLVNRDGNMGGIIALYFDGATCTFKELPLPNDTINMNKVYNSLSELKKNTIDKVFFLFDRNKAKKDIDKKKKLFNFANFLKKLWQKF